MFYRVFNNSFSSYFFLPIFIILELSETIKINEITYSSFLIKCRFLAIVTDPNVHTGSINLFSKIWLFITKMIKRLHKSKKSKRKRSLNSLIEFAPKNFFFKFWTLDKAYPEDFYEYPDQYDSAKNKANLQKRLIQEYWNKIVTWMRAATKECINFVDIFKIRLPLTD